MLQGRYDSVSSNGTLTVRYNWYATLLIFVKVFGDCLIFMHVHTQNSSVMYKMVNLWINVHHSFACHCTAENLVQQKSGLYVLISQGLLCKHIKVKLNFYCKEMANLELLNIKLTLNYIIKQYCGWTRCNKYPYHIYIYIYIYIRLYSIVSLQIKYLHNNGS